MMRLCRTHGRMATQQANFPQDDARHRQRRSVIGTTRREFLDHFVFFNKHDLQTRLDLLQAYCNEERAHSSLEMRTPEKMAAETIIVKTVVSLSQYRWKSHYRGLYQLPVAAFVRCLRALSGKYQAP